MTETIWVAIITACATFIPTIVTIIVNNFFQLKFKRFELQQLSQDKAVLNYLEALGTCYGPDGNVSVSDAIQYQKSVNALLYYFPDLDTKLLDTAINSIRKTKPSDKMDFILPIIKKLSKSRKEI